MKFSMLINTKMPTIVGISYLLAGKFSCSAIFGKKEFAVVSNLRFRSRTFHAKLSMKKGPRLKRLTKEVQHLS